MAGKYVTPEELLTLEGIEDNVQDQLDAKVNNADFEDGDVTAKLLTGFESGAGGVLVTDSILSGMEKLDGNIGAVGMASLPKAADGSASETLDEHAFFRSQIAVELTQVSFLPDNTLTADDTDFATINVYSRDSNGTDQELLASVTTEDTGGSGDWVAFKPVALTIENALVKANRVVTVEIEKAGSGVVIPKGTLQLRFKTFVDPEDITRASFALLMDEVSGSITDAVGGVTLIENNTPNTFGVTGGGPGYDPGVQMAATAGGFRKAYSAGNDLGVDLDTGSGNLLLRCRLDTQGIGTGKLLFCTTLVGTGHAGFCIRANSSGGASNSGLLLTLMAQDESFVTTGWYGNEVGDAMWNGGVHTHEFQIDRVNGLVRLYTDGILQGPADPAGSDNISSLAGKSLSRNGDGIGLCSDSRAGIDLNLPFTVWFVRVKKTVV